MILHDNNDIDNNYFICMDAELGGLLWTGLCDPCKDATDDGNDWCYHDDIPGYGEDDYGQHD